MLVFEGGVLEYLWHSDNRGSITTDMYYVYVLRSKMDGTTYIGYTEDVGKRLIEHNKGLTKSLKHKIPMELVHVEEYENKTDARKRELRLKNNSWEKEQLFKNIFPDRYKK
jgi:putative endonuclease